MQYLILIQKHLEVDAGHCGNTIYNCAKVTKCSINTIKRNLVVVGNPVVKLGFEIVSMFMETI